MSKTIDEYIAQAPAEFHESLTALRNTIQAAAPESVELISYQIPTYKIYNRPLVGFSAHKNHCSLHIMSPVLAKEMEAELKEYGQRGATLNFRAAKPLPAAVVTKVVQARVAQIAKAL
jgi:uncharacterized protein YdhG (YjbR/CyaY superfamily)